ncbi:phosphatase PAP2 family protein [Sphingosinicella soli]|uniref:Inositolphosphotransferase Aur1/Ipt1 domain-containing protein n=1 Tax=Sphingosinicella soli TaxID=333708 RepID=A0A7W7B4H1_9SPHN|nr:phosphatase PAP2 family protein [Sphingosinicella soli]MBB4633779.1 hypothetical protein [Sphingosinicella soli]
MYAVLRRPFSIAREEWVWLAPLVLMVAGIYGVSELVARWNEASTASLVIDYMDKALRAIPLVVSLGLLYHLIRALLSGEAAPLSSMVLSARAQLQDTSLLVSRVVPLALMPVLFAAMGMLKMQIPQIMPFYLDDTFAALDKALFLGRQPWELTHALFGSADATLVIDRLYTLWVFGLSVAIGYFALIAPRAERARFFLNFTAIWIVLGVLGAYIGSSAGPCFLAPMASASAPEFAGLMERLASIDATLKAGGGMGLGALHWQTMLWTAHETDTIGFSMGISAMPSLHNAIAFLYVLLAFRIGRTAGTIAALFALTTFIGSIHLGWHYAVDGLVAFAGVYAVWWGVERYLRAV